MIVVDTDIFQYHGGSCSNRYLMAGCEFTRQHVAVLCFIVSRERREVRGRSRCHRHIDSILVIDSQRLARYALVIAVRGIVGDKGEGLVAGHRQHGHINRSGCCRTADGIGIGAVADRKTRDVAGDLRTTSILDFELTDSQLVPERNARQGKYTAAFGHIARALGIVQGTGERSEGAVLHTQGTEVRCLPWGLST